MPTTPPPRGLPLRILAISALAAGATAVVLLTLGSPAPTPTVTEPSRAASAGSEDDDAGRAGSKSGGSTVPTAEGASVDETSSSGGGQGATGRQATTYEALGTSGRGTGGGRPGEVVPPKGRPARPGTANPAINTTPVARSWRMVEPVRIGADPAPIPAELTATDADGDALTFLLADPAGPVALAATGPATCDGGVPITCTLPAELTVLDPADLEPGLLATLATSFTVVDARGATSAPAEVALEVIRNRAPTAETAARRVLATRPQSPGWDWQNPDPPSGSSVYLSDVILRAVDPDGDELTFATPADDRSLRLTDQWCLDADPISGARTCTATAVVDAWAVAGRTDLPYEVRDELGDASAAAFTLEVPFVLERELDRNGGAGDTLAERRWRWTSEIDWSPLLPGFLWWGAVVHSEDYELGVFETITPEGLEDVAVEVVAERVLTDADALDETCVEGTPAIRDGGRLAIAFTDPPGQHATAWPCWVTLRFATSDGLSTERELMVLRTLDPYTLIDNDLPVLTPGQTARVRLFEDLDARLRWYPWWPRTGSPVAEVQVGDDGFVTITAADTVTEARTVRIALNAAPVDKPPALPAEPHWITVTVRPDAVPIQVEVTPQLTLKVSTLPEIQSVLSAQTVLIQHSATVTLSGNLYQLSTDVVRHSGTGQLLTPTGSVSTTQETPLTVYCHTCENPGIVTDPAELETVASATRFLEQTTIHNAYRTNHLGMIYNLNG